MFRLEFECHSELQPETRHAWGDHLASGNAAMDRMQREFVALANALMQADDKSFVRWLARQRHGGAPVSIVRDRRRARE